MSDTLSREENLVFEVIQEYLMKYNSFNSSTIVPLIEANFGKRNININIQGIKESLKSLAKKRMIAEGSRLTKNDILLNSNRTMIHNFIKLNPGVHFNRIVKKVNLSIFTVEWHLKMLVKFEYLRREKIDNLECYFDLSIDSKEAEAFHFITREKYQKIIQYLKFNEEGYTKTHLSEELGMHYNTITKYTSKLEKLGVLIRKSHSNEVLFFLNVEYYHKLNKKQRNQHIINKDYKK